MDFLERAALFDHTVRVALSPPHTSRALESATQGHAMPKTEIRNLRQATFTFGKPIQEGVPGLQQGPKAKLPRPTYSISRDDCHLPVTIRLTGGYARCPP